LIHKKGFSSEKVVRLSYVVETEGGWGPASWTGEKFCLGCAPFLFPTHRDTARALSLSLSLSLPLSLSLCSSLALGGVKRVCRCINLGKSLSQKCLSSTPCQPMSWQSFNDGFCVCLRAPISFGCGDEQETWLDAEENSRPTKDFGHFKYLAEN
jgi:hypothetical protein